MSVYSLVLQSYPLKTKPGKPKKEVNLLIPASLLTTCRYCEEPISWGKMKNKEKAFPLEKNASGAFVPHLCAGAALYWNA